MTEQKIIVPNIGDFKEVEVIEVLVKEGQEIKKDDNIRRGEKIQTFDLWTQIKSPIS
jgi:hypothetical protein